MAKHPTKKIDKLKANGNGKAKSPPAPVRPVDGPVFRPIGHGPLTDEQLREQLSKGFAAESQLFRVEAECAERLADARAQLTAILLPLTERGHCGPWEGAHAMGRMSRMPDTFSISTHTWHDGDGADKRARPKKAFFKGVPMPKIQSLGGKPSNAPA